MKLQVCKTINVRVYLKVMVLWGFMTAMMYQLALSLVSRSIYNIYDIRVKVNSLGEGSRLKYSASDNYESGCYLGKYCIRYLITPNTVCTTGRTKLLFSFILSATPDFGHRQLIRDTWANSTLFRKDDLDIVFVLAKMRNETEQLEKLQEEARVHDDLLMVDFVEDYDNLTLKTISGLYWTAHFCPHAKFVLKTDDDVIVNTFAILSRLTRMARREKTTGILMGDLRHNTKVSRTGKFKLTVKEFAPDVFPDYLFGLGYIMSADVVQKLSHVAMNDSSESFLRMEDALVSGIMAAKAYISPSLMKHAMFYYPGYRMKAITRGKWWKQLLWHGNKFNEEQKMDIWNILITFSKTSIPHIPR